MKSLFTLLILPIAIATTAIAQNTTEEEYNWMAKGYSVMVSSGLDMKKGYYFDDDQEHSESKGSYSFSYKVLRRERDKSLAGILITARSSVSGNSYYYGLPVGEWKQDADAWGAGYVESYLMTDFLKAVNVCNILRAVISFLVTILGTDGCPSLSPTL